ncbi:redox-sensing transcriptional repressor Rex [Porphyromonas pogonae]|uniref:redox-sensing transcriptional repressor Rex n=1 Tax=Porphyromonas pogonae TaxID=867595 RepID=UPI002E774B9D|nr:redox-sensing transcriptional repressor Rex [Porphyromonas pogonae]
MSGNTLSNSKSNEGLFIPEPSLRRLPWYLSYVKFLQAEGQEQVSSTQIARGVGVDSSLVAKDLSYVDLQGRTRVGYKINEMIAVLDDFLGFTTTHKAVIFGVGSLGAALLSDHGLRQFGLEIVAGFDVKSELIGKTLEGTPIYHMDELSSKIDLSVVNIAILTVPIQSAQDVTNKIIDYGFRAIWNFTPFRISVPEGVVVQNTSMYAHLAVMFNRMKSNG